MFLKRKITGLKPNTNYTIFFELEIASNAATDGVGAGGSPSALTIKVGASPKEPLSVYVQQVGLYQMQNIDKGEQSMEGKDVKVLGDIGVRPGQKEYAIIERNNHNRPHRAVTNDKGEIWLLIGTDSGYESQSVLYYQSVKVIFTKI